MAGLVGDAVRGLVGVRPRRLVTPRADLPWRVPVAAGEAPSAVVVGGGIAGMSAAVVLAERGVRVTVLEAADHLGGRLGAWPRPMATGGVETMEHGFHGFFRQYYTWRALLRRIDPELSFLRPLDGYPVISRAWPAEDFADLPGVPPFNLLALVLRSPSLRLADLRHVDRVAASALLEYDRTRTYAAFDLMSAAELLDRLAMPDRARAVLFEVFSHSFFNREDDFSAAELIMMFHFYFLANPEGLAMDVPVDDFATCVWDPFARLLDSLGAPVRTGAPVDRVEPGPEGGWSVVLAGSGEAVPAPHVVLATDPGALRRLLAASPGLARRGSRLAAEVEALPIGAPYAVTRYWTDRPPAAARSVFSGVTRESTVDAVAVYSRLERGATAWAARTGGGVVELHSYACDDSLDATTAASRMWTELGALWPEVRGMRVLEADSRVGRDAPGFPPGSDATRPSVLTDAPGVRLAGDWVRLDFPSALMERAAVSGVLAANDVLAAYGVRAEPVDTVRPRGLLRPRPPDTDPAIASRA